MMYQRKATTKVPALEVVNSRKQVCHTSSCRMVGRVIVIVIVCVPCSTHRRVMLGFQAKLKNEHVP